MRAFLKGSWKVLSFPFRALWWLVSLPFRAVSRVARFMNQEPDEQPLPEAFSASVRHPGAILDHVEVLRRHLLRMLLVLAVGVVICGTYTTQIIDFLSTPIGGIDKLQAIDVTETVGVFMRVALFGGFALALPYLAFEVWLFAAPGLHRRARWMGLIGIPLTLVFFLTGVWFAYVYMLPTALPFLLNFMNIQTIPRVSSYINFVTNLLFWIGISFEFPLLVYVLTFMGILKPRMLARGWRVAVIVIAVLAAMITPTVDPVNMALVMAPMIVLYFFSIGLSLLAVIGRKQKTAPPDPV
jgi:sec-independent protein translocase protein TatC